MIGIRRSSALGLRAGTDRGFIRSQTAVQETLFMRFRSLLHRGRMALITKRGKGTQLFSYQQALKKSCVPFSGSESFRDSSTPFDEKGNTMNNHTSPIQVATIWKTALPAFFLAVGAAGV